MTNSRIHTHMLPAICLIILFQFAQLVTDAQETGDSIQVMDTVIETTSGYTTEDTIFHFDQVTQTPTVQLRRIPENLEDSLRKDRDFWYAQTGPAKKKSNKTSKDNTLNSQPFYRQAWFRLMLWIIIIGSFIAVVIWYLAVSNVRLFRKQPPVLPRDESKNIGEDIFSINYDHEIEEALSSKNYRLTIRLLYLQSLKFLSEKEIIQYKPGFTNSDYLAQLYGSSYYKEFFRLTRDFDYTWYGKFDVSEIGFLDIQKDFATFKDRLHYEKI